MTPSESGWGGGRDLEGPSPSADWGRGASRWPAGTTKSDRRCWLCGAATDYRHCKIICTSCGFTRDCSDP